MGYYGKKCFKPVFKKSWKKEHHGKRAHGCKKERPSYDYGKKEHSHGCKKEHHFYGKKEHSCGKKVHHCWKKKEHHKKWKPFC
ncbi:hypothetical protein [Paenibacillus sp. YIM B09110]|uniref:hypothetical protein n=1 Tax=Paenibacillus sp. YIM B09110 TaxID=3126102 RepID=UPI00301E5CB4